MLGLMLFIVFIHDQEKKADLWGGKLPKHTKLFGLVKSSLSTSEELEREGKWVTMSTHKLSTYCYAGIPLTHPTVPCWFGSFREVE